MTPAEDLANQKQVSHARQVAAAKKRAETILALEVEELKDPEFSAENDAFERQIVVDGSTARLNAFNDPKLSDDKMEAIASWQAPPVDCRTYPQMRDFVMIVQKMTEKVRQVS